MRICRFCTIYTQECRAKLYDAKRLKATHVRCSHSIMCQLFMSSVIKHATLARNNKVIIILRSTERQTRNAASSPFEFEKRKNPEHNFWMMFKWWSTHGPMIYLQWKINVYKSISKQSLIRINQSDFVSFFSPLFLSHSFLIVSFRISLPLVVTCFFFSFHFQLNNDPSIQSEKQVKKNPVLVRCDVDGTAVAAAFSFFFQHFDNLTYDKVRKRLMNYSFVFPSTGCFFSSPSAFTSTSHHPLRSVFSSNKAFLLPSNIYKRYITFFSSSIDYSCMLEFLWLIFKSIRFFIHPGNGFMFARMLVICYIGFFCPTPPPPSLHPTFSLSVNLQKWIFLYILIWGKCLIHQNELDFFSSVYLLEHI